MADSKVTDRKKRDFKMFLIFFLAVWYPSHSKLYVKQFRHIPNNNNNNNIYIYNEVQ